jgi:hypothetical protein
MPYADPARRRAYDTAYKRRTEGWTKKRMDTRLTLADIKTTLRGLFDLVVAEVRTADTSSLQREAKLRIKVRAVEIGLRAIELTNHEQRIAALEEQSQ